MPLKRQIYTVTVSDDGHGCAKADPASGVTGTKVRLTAVPKSGYKFNNQSYKDNGLLAFRTPCCPVIWCALVNIVVEPICI